MDQAIIVSALDELCQRDAELAGAVRTFGYPPPRIRPAGFETLLNIIVSQQISTSAAQAIMGRLRALMPQLNAQSLLAMDTKMLRGAGLSGRKVEYAKGLAQAIVDGVLRLPELHTMSDQDAIRAVSALRGFGVWSAEIYLMFSLQRTDVFPADDLALRVALQRLRGLAARPSAKQARTLVQEWAPWRSVGALFLWHYYQGAPA